MMKQFLTAVGLLCCAVSYTLEASAIDLVYVDSPLKIHEEEAPLASRGIATRLQLDISGLEGVGRGQHLFMEDFPLDQNRRVTLQLEEASALAHDAKLIVMRHDEHGRLIEVERPWPTCFIFNGTVVGEPTSKVFLAVCNEIVNGWITVDGTRFVIGTRYSDRLTLIYDENNVPEGMINWARYECNVQATKDGSQNATGGGERDPGDECPQVKIAIDTDFEFTYELFDGSETAAANYVNTLVSSVAVIYKAQISVPSGAGINLKLQYLRLWTANDDPWTGTDTGSQLSQFSDYWRTNMGGVDRHLAHLLNARNLGGGMAMLRALCSLDIGYAVSGGLSGSFPTPLEDEQAENWDPIVFAHETGHNFGMIHTHDPLWPYLEPTIDDPNPDMCGNDDCAGASGAPIMSYCHLCEPGYISNIAMEFDDDNAERAELFIEHLECSFYPEDPPTIIDDRATTDMNTPVDVYVLANDIANDCNTLSITAFDRRGLRGGLVTQTADGVLTYTPTGAITGTDSFSYTARDGSNNFAVGNVIIEITRPPSGGGGGGGINPDDVVFVITLWGSRTGDLTGDGNTDIDDLLAVLEGKARPTLR